jgi:spore cortex formation protein SpoVR/YcgB (stage V sporulation)
MNDFEEQTVIALRTLFDKVDTLRHINIRDMLKPDMYYHYEDTIQAAYDALTTVEDALTSVGMKLEYEHWRLGGAVEELKPLMIHTRSSSDIIIEAFEQRISEKYDEL